MTFLICSRPQIKTSGHIYEHSLRKDTDNCWITWSAWSSFILFAWQNSTISSDYLCWWMIFIISILVPCLLSYFFFYCFYLIDKGKCSLLFWASYRFLMLSIIHIWLLITVLLLVQLFQSTILALWRKFFFSGHELTFSQLSSTILGAAILGLELCG